MSDKTTDTFTRIKLSMGASAHRSIRDGEIERMLDLLIARFETDQDAHAEVLWHYWDQDKHRNVAECGQLVVWPGSFTCNAEIFNKHPCLKCKAAMAQPAKADQPSAPVQPEEGTVYRWNKAELCYQDQRFRKRSGITEASTDGGKTWFSNRYVDIDEHLPSGDLVPVDPDKQSPALEAGKLYASKVVVIEQGTPAPAQARGEAMSDARLKFLLKVWNDKHDFQELAEEIDRLRAELSGRNERIEKMDEEHQRILRIAEETEIEIGDLRAENQQLKIALAEFLFDNEDAFFRKKLSDQEKEDEIERLKAECQRLEGMVIRGSQALQKENAELNDENSRLTSELARLADDLADLLPAIDVKAIKRHLDAMVRAARMIKPDDARRTLMDEICNCQRAILTLLPPEAK